MATNAFITFFDMAAGESNLKGKEKWIEIQGWDWEVESETSWTKGGGASVGKPNPGKLNFEHRFDTSSTAFLGYICTGKAFPKAQLEMTKASSINGIPQTYFTMAMEGIYITKVSNSGTEDGLIAQKIEMVFKTVRIDYRAQNEKDGSLGVPKTFTWDIPAGSASS